MGGKMKSIYTYTLLILVALMSQQVKAMDVSTHSNVVLMSGDVLNGDLDKLKSQLQTNPQVKTVVLRNSYGGHVATGYAVGELLRQLAMKTVVSGYCISSCSRMFLGGVERQFAEDLSGQLAYIGFHGHYNSSGSLNDELVQKMGLLDWIIKHTDGKADRELVTKWISFRRNTDIVAFFHPSAAFPDKLSVRNCERYTRSSGAPLRCPAINTDALVQGVITTLDRYDLPSELK
jgi:hypothetical protein